MRCRPLCVARGQLLQRCPPWRWACASRATNDRGHVLPLQTPSAAPMGIGFVRARLAGGWGISFHTTPRHGTGVLGQRRPCQVGGRRGDQRHLHCEGHGHGLPSVPAFQRSAAAPHPLCFWHGSALAFGDLACRAAASTASQAPTTRACPPLFSLSQPKEVNHDR